MTSEGKDSTQLTRSTENKHATTEMANAEAKRQHFMLINFLFKTFSLFPVWYCRLSWQLTQLLSVTVRRYAFRIMSNRNLSLLTDHIAGWFNRVVTLVTLLVVETRQVGARRRTL